MSALISIPAGRCHRRSEDSKWIDPSAEKGLLELSLEDDLLHLWWKSRVSGATEDELIIFPGEATFDKVEQDPSGRTHILKFSSSDQKYFFWFQRASKSGDVRAQVDINALLQDPSYTPGSALLPNPSTPQRNQERSWPPTPGAPRLSHPEPAPRAPAPVAETPTQVAGSSTAATGSMDVDEGQGSGHQEEMARLLVEWAQHGGLAVEEDARLTDVLSPANISQLLTSHPDLASSLTPLLPPGLSLPSNPTASDLIPILTAPQFTDAIASLDNALRSGGLPGGILRDLGLPESAGTSVKGFLDALIGLSKPEGEGPPASDERMDED
ncbi:hypothetical protein CI109_104622 [Kwoniella shandongensis]|uniref:Uncharacterized protein n=1 Tax=Kwoniella shandongensis TaxID=1734106 RepID=A0A5M6BVA5_9TREE|nr:uncharacterized protein CI109_004788 [Kwoniella shandongensis]KAA5526788.1 hypothetical protein CI109_004788 [Kwoniella shandongensis]